MADTHKDLNYLRFYYASQDSLKDKDILKNQAFDQYKNNVAGLFFFPAAFQLMQISRYNRPEMATQYYFLRRMKIVSLLGATAAIYLERQQLEKKWDYYNKFYPEPTQLQRTLVEEAAMFKEREARGLTEQSLQDKKFIDPVTQKTYEQMYQLPPTNTMEGNADVNPSSIQNHYGSS